MLENNGRCRRGSWREWGQVRPKDRTIVGDELRNHRSGIPRRCSPACVAMALCAVAALEPHVREIAIVAADDAPKVLGVPVLLDLVPGRGPLGGMVTVLERSLRKGDVGALVLACGLPLVDATLIASLVAAWAGEDVVAPIWKGRLQPLCALWCVSALSAAREALVKEQLSVLALVARLRLRVVAEGEWRYPVEPLSH